MKCDFYLEPFLILGIIFLSGCTSSNAIKEKQYNSYFIDSILINNNGTICAKLKDINSYYYKEYTVLTFSYSNSLFPKNNDTVMFIVISSNENKDTNDYNEFVQMEENEEYCLALIKENAPIKVTFFVSGQEDNFIHYLNEENLIFYKKGYIVRDVYKSKDIKGIYVIQEKRKNR